MSVERAAPTGEPIGPQRKDGDPASRPSSVGDTRERGGASIFYGWRIVAVAFLAQGITTSATVYIYGVFLKPVVAEFDVSRMVAGMGLSLLYLVQAVISPPLGRALDRHSIRGIMASGALILSAGFALLAATRTLWQVGLVFALIIGAGATMAGPLPASTLVANWFVAGRGKALGLAALGISFCGLLLPPLAAWLVGEVGWRGACLALGIGIGVVVCPAVLAVVVSRPEERNLAPDGASRNETSLHLTTSRGEQWTTIALLQERNFWSIMLAVGLTAGALVAMLTHLVAFATDRGFQPQDAAFVMSVVAGASMAGKLAFGAIMDRIDKRIAFWLMVGIQALGWSILLAEPEYAALLVAAAILGFGAGGNVPICGALVGATFGRLAFGRVMGLMSPAMLVLTILSPPLTGYVYDQTGSYALAFKILFGVTLLAAVPIAFLRIPVVEPGAPVMNPDGAT